MKLGLQLKLQQKLAPQLIQSLKMLQMPMLKLEQTLRHELSVNPLLEEIETVEPEEKTDDEPEVDILKDEETDEEEKVDWETFLGDDYEDDYQYKSTYDKREEEYERAPVMQKTLTDHLLEQLSFLKLSEEDHLIGEYVIGNISPKGYLVCDAEEMSKELDLPAERIQKIIDLVKTFDPPGVGARDLRESLLIQLKEKKLEDSIAYRIVDQFINVLDKKSILQISRSMGIPFEKAQQAMDAIKTLSPTPAHGRFDNPAAAITPDLVVEQVGDKFVVYHNDKNFPRLRINPNYRQLLRKGNSTEKDTKKYVREKLEQARWLLNSINQRRTTMIRVMEAIIDEQMEFFRRGPAFLKPLIMDDIARRVEMNIATISRVVNGKYVQTPQGVYELRYFFNTGISKTDGDEMSKRHVKTKIEEIIKNENPEKPYSDQEIYRILQKDGIKLARRTVTKYREELKIQPARFRKRVAN